MTVSACHRISVLLLVLLVSIPAGAGARKAPTPPPDFDDRAMTGRTGLETRISSGIALERLSPEELEALKEVALEDGQEGELSRYVAALLGRDDLPGAIDVLHERSWADIDNESKLGDVLDLAMGQLRWGTCAQIALTRLERRMDAALFRIRALCLQRSGDPEGAADNIEAADAMDPMAPDTKALLVAQMHERGGGSPLPPVTDRIFEPFRSKTTRGGPLDRLFVFHLLGRKDPGWIHGTLDWGGFGASELREVILSRSRSYRYCQAAAKHQSKRSRKDLSGSVTIVWSIDALGRVVDPQLVDPSWGDHDQADWLNACLVDQVKRLRFPQPYYGLPMPARHRFSFAD